MSDIRTRKDQHLNLAVASQLTSIEQDTRFAYEPLVDREPSPFQFEIAGKKLKFPLWISSMTGGGFKSGKINQTLALAAREFGLGISSGSCRVLLHDRTVMADFDLRKSLGESVPYFLNIGYAQLKDENFSKINQLVKDLYADGIVIHINPLQEALQGDAETDNRPIMPMLQNAFAELSCPIILKEVGQGFGPQSLKKLLSLDFAALELSAFGGTNFSKMELLRTNLGNLAPLSKVGNTLDQMIPIVNELLASKQFGEKKFILSGGVKNFIDGYYYLSKLEAEAIYGQASILLQLAMEGELALFKHLEAERRGFELAGRYLTVL